MKHKLTKNLRCEEGIITSLEKNGLEIDIPKENRHEELSMTSPEELENLSRYFVGEKVIAIIYDNLIERHTDGTRRKALKEIVLPDDPDYEELMGEIKSDY